MANIQTPHNFTDQSFQSTVPHKTSLITILSLIFWTLSCGSGGEPPAIETNWTVVQLQSQVENQELLQQMVEVSHCGEPDPQIIECPAGTEDSFSYDLAQTNYTPALIAIDIAETLGMGQPVTNQLNLATPAPGSSYRYQIIKQFQVIRGDALAQSSDGEETTLSYTYVATCNISTQSRVQLDCETNQEIAPSPPPPPSPSNTPTMTPTPTTIPIQTPTTTPILLGQNCSSFPDETFSGLWPAYRSIIGCAESELTTIPTIAEEAFEGGHLFWRNDTDEVYIIFDRLKDGADLAEGQWELNPSWRKWDGTDPDGIGLSPPPGLVEPKRGFGWLWRNHLDRENGPLGWALDQEYGFDNVGQIQRFEQGFMFKGSSSKIYILTDDGFFFAK